VWDFLFMETVKTKRKFRAHENLVYLTFKRQAGSIGKAILEGVMNSIDAGASEIQVSFSDKKVVIKDDGKGMNTIKDIDDYFDCVGAPHELDSNGVSTDARFGTFRLGRGQMFCFGVNRWRTGPFEMIIDMKQHGLAYDMVESHAKPTKGCIVEIDLYEPLDKWVYDNAIDEVKKYIRYTDVPVLLNGLQVSTDPKDTKWDFEDELFYLKVDTERTTGGIEVFQQGVYVRNLAAHQWGISGTLVSKGPMVLNVARNDIMQNECPVWKAASKLLKSQFTKNVSKKKLLDSSERESLLKRIGNKDIKNTSEYASCQLFQDANGKCWSWNMIKLLPSRFALLPSGKVGICFAKAYDSVACRVTDNKLALVLDRSILPICRCTEEEFIKNILAPFGNGWRSRVDERFELTTLDQVSKKMTEAAKLIGPKDQTKKEARILKALNTANHEIACAVYRDEYESERPFSWSSGNWLEFQRLKDSFVRRLVIGQLEGAGAFTNGTDYVAFCRDYVRDTGTTLPGFFKLVSVLLHEYCHDAPDTETHNHTPTFYETFEQHHHFVGLWAWEAFKAYCKIMLNETGKIPQKESAHLHECIRASYYDDFLEGYLDDSKAKTSSD
jgi:hypothetical protein